MVQDNSSLPSNCYMMKLGHILLSLKSFFPRLLTHNMHSACNFTPKVRLPLKISQFKKN
uniref:Uncharacterized protein n=1 Tax=Arundo donax TaxID=35708 RepID=A0A0A9GGQ0_ARUDO